MTKENVTRLRDYDAFIRRKRIVFTTAIIATIVIALYAISAGSLHIPVAEVVRTLLGGGETQSRLIIMGIRLPRVTAAIVVGATLASSGAVMQCVLQNPLASEATLGISQGAAFGAALGIIVFGGGVVNSDSAATAVAINNPYIVTLCAFVFGLLSTVVIILLSQFKKKLGPGGLILAGIALSSMFLSGSTLLQYFADETKISAVVFWTFGNLGSAGWTELLILAVVFVAAMVYFLLNGWNYNAKESGADTAKSLGVNTSGHHQLYGAHRAAYHAPVCRQRLPLPHTVLCGGRRAPAHPGRHLRQADHKSRHSSGRSHHVFSGRTDVPFPFVQGV
jgi:iron complex transport system permease protein